MKKIDGIICFSKKDLGIEMSDFDLARRDIVTVSNLVDHIHAQSSKAYELMRALREENQVYRGNCDVLEQLAMINLTSSDAHDFLLDDKKTLGILEEGAFE